MKNNNLKIDFIKVFSNVPHNLRNNIVATHNNQPYSWNAVYFEVQVETELADILLNNLRELDII